MPMQSIVLRPGVDLEQTPALNEAGIVQSQLIRSKNGLTQAYGGWQTFGQTTIPSTVRDLHAWQDIQGVDYLGVAATGNLVAMTATSYIDITPATFISSAPSINVSISTAPGAQNTVTVVDPNSGMTVYDTVVFETPVSIGNLLLQGAYGIEAVLSTGSYTIISSIAASTTIASSGILPTFTTTANSAFVTVSQPNNTAQAILGLEQNYLVPTAVGGLTIVGAYGVNSVIDSTNFTINSRLAASAAATVTMNSGVAQYLYYVTNGPPTTGTGWGAGGWGLGAWGVGSTGAASVSSAAVGITSLDWTTDNWGEIFLACQQDGPIFQWSPDLGTATAQIISEAPITNGGMFVSMPQQVLVVWKSVQSTGTQDNLIVRWSDAQDFTQWQVSPQTIAGSFHIPTGSVIRGGLQAPNYGIIWTDIDVWIMQFIDATIAFNFTRAGSGCGLIGRHAAGVLGNDVYWCGQSNFFKMTSQGIEVMRCPVWDFIFQNLNTAEMAKIRCAPNSAFNEIAWFFPSTGMTENDSYVKYNLVDQTWDYGKLGRTAWVDVSVLGTPIGADTGGVISQHEMGNMVSGVGNPSFKTGWWSINDGSNLAFVDFFMPDFIWGTYGTHNSQLEITFFSLDYPGDTPRSYGPYTVTQATEYITPRIRGRLMSMQINSLTNDNFWRLGRCRYRWSEAGRR